MKAGVLSSFGPTGCLVLLHEPWRESPLKRSETEMFGGTRMVNPNDSYPDHSSQFPNPWVGVELDVGRTFRTSPSHLRRRHHRV